MIRFYIITAYVTRHLIIFTAPSKGAARIFGNLALNALSSLPYPFPASFKLHKKERRTIIMLFRLVHVIVLFSYTPRDRFQGASMCLTVFLLYGILQ